MFLNCTYCLCLLDRGLQVDLHTEVESTQILRRVGVASRQMQLRATTIVVVGFVAACGCPPPPLLFYYPFKLVRVVVHSEDL